jgi:hypothetical protein
MDDISRCPMDRKKFDFQKDLEFSKNIFNTNLQYSNIEFMEKASRLVSERNNFGDFTEIELIYGNEHQTLNTSENNSHKWTAFVKLKKSIGDKRSVINKFKNEINIIELVGTVEKNLSQTSLDKSFKDSDIIKNVTFRLHPTFNPPTVVITKAPFQISRIGWGTFNIAITIQFNDYLKLENIELDHYLSFDRNLSTSSKTICIDFNKVNKFKNLI